MNNITKGYIIWTASMITALIVQSQPILLWVTGIIMGSMFYYSDRKD